MRMKHKFGTWVEIEGPWDICIKARVLCSDGKLRITKRLSVKPDSFFSVSAAIKVSGKTVAGFMTAEDGTLIFHAVTYGKNHILLPNKTSEQIITEFLAKHPEVEGV